MTFSMPSLTLILRRLTVRMESLLPQKLCLQARSLLGQTFVCLSTSTYPFCWKFAHIQPVLKKGDRSNPSNYRPIALISCLSKVFESVLNKKIEEGIYQLTTFFLIASMVSGKAGLLVIFLFF